MDPFKKIKRLARHIEVLKSALLRPLGDLPLPIHIQIEPTDACNLSCPSCPRADGKGIFLPPAGFAKILKEAQPLKIAFSGLGEPTIHPRLFEMIRIAKSQGRQINITSNMTIAGRVLEEMVESGLDLLKISIDAASAETYSAVRGGDHFNTVIENIRRLERIKERLGSKTPYLRFQFVVQGKNFREMPRLVELARELKIAAIYFQPLELDYVKDQAEELVGRMTWEELLEAFREARSIAERLSIPTNLKELIADFSTEWKKYQYPPLKDLTSYPCFRPWVTAYITASGEMWPCCKFGGMNYSVGNVLTSSFEEVWNGEKMKEFRGLLREKKRPFSICKNCAPERISDLAGLRRIWPGLFRFF